MTSLPLIGYFPKKIVRLPDWLPQHVVAIRSASQCLSKGPDNWIEYWMHNEFGLYSTMAAAIAIIPEPDRSQFELHAYRMLPSVFDHGERLPFELLRIDVEPLTQEFESLGFDAVAISCSNFFECSPLSCNNLTEEIETNEHCLLPTIDAAVEAAERFSREEPEPGPYYVVEVLRRSNGLSGSEG